VRGHEVPAAIELNGKTATGIEVPGEVVEGLGSDKRPAVRITIGGYTYRRIWSAAGGMTAACPQARQASSASRDDQAFGYRSAPKAIVRAGAAVASASRPERA